MYPIKKTTRLSRVRTFLPSGPNFFGSNLFNCSDSIVDGDLLLAAMEPLEFAAHSHLIAQTELKSEQLSKSDLFELRKVKAHLMAWLVQLKSLLKRASPQEARLLIDALDATALMLHRADLLIMWGHITQAPKGSNYWGCPE